MMDGLTQAQEILLSMQGRTFQEMQYALYKIIGDWDEAEALLRQVAAEGIKA